MGRKRPVTIIAMALAAIMTIVACGGDSGPRMTVEEYATACEELGVSIHLFWFGVGTEAALGSIERAASRAKDWNPPAELQEFHGATVGFAEWSLRALQDIGWFDLLPDFVKAEEEGDQERMSELRSEASKLNDTLAELEDEAEERRDEIERIAADLSPTTQRLLQDAHCY